MSEKINMKDFLQELENNNINILKEGVEEGGKISEDAKKMLDAAKISYKWAYEPDGYNLVVLEHDENGDKKDSWSIVFYEVGEERAAGKKRAIDLVDDETNESILDINSVLSEAATQKLMSQQEVGDYKKIVNMCMEIATNDKYKGDLSDSSIQAIVNKAK